MTSARPLSAGHITIVFEFGATESDFMTASVRDALRARLGKREVRTLGGFLRTYRPGGARLSRVLNLAWVYVRTSWHLVFQRPDAVVVRSTPPGIQLWTVFWAGIRGVPVLCWLMDYHPELEACALERRGWTATAAFLRRIDRSAMQRFEAVVVLDDAMARIAASRSGGRPVLVHPTWSSRPPSAPVTVPKLKPGRRCFVYGGNLGAAHDLAPLETLLGQAALHGMVELHVIGSGASGEARFRDMARRVPVALHVHPRTPFEKMPALFETVGADVGIVLLSDDSAGLVSPSKFSAYLAADLPILYIGPAETNSDLVCTRFGAGWSLRSRLSAESVQGTCANIWSDENVRSCAERVAEARRYFESFNGETFADIAIAALHHHLSTEPRIKVR